MTLSSLKIPASIALGLSLSACIESKCDSDANAGSPDACDSIQEGDTDTDADSDTDTDTDTDTESDSDSDTNATRFDTAVEQGLRPEGHFKAKPDFALLDYNPTSPTSEQAISPRDYLQKVSGWYFAHAT